MNIDEKLNRIEELEGLLTNYRLEVARMKPNIGGIKFSPNDKRRDQISAISMRLNNELSVLINEIGS
jgi:hypothetical protein